MLRAAFWKSGANLTFSRSTSIESEQMSQDTALAGESARPAGERARVAETERASPRYRDIDVWEPSDILESMVEGQFVAVAAVRAALPALERAALAMETRLAHGGRLVYAGAGTSGRLAVQDGAELMPTFSWPRQRLLLLMAGGDGALVRAVAGAEDAGEDGAGLVQQHRIGASDVLIAVAASGTTPFTVSALRAARQHGALTVGIANNAGTPLLEAADCPVLLDTGPEPIAGSTRMKAATAQRIALNLLSSLLMIRLGGVCGGLMVDLVASNNKLARRAEAMLMRLTDRGGAEARSALERADGSVKIAALVLKGCDPDGAHKILDRAGGHLRAAMAIADDLTCGSSAQRKRAVADAVTTLVPAPDSF
jgi:N-acetylmuramic acid 6-phosphate etherase